MKFGHIKKLGNMLGCTVYVFFRLQVQYLHAAHLSDGNEKIKMKSCLELLRFTVAHTERKQDKILHYNHNYAKSW